MIITESLHTLKRLPPTKEFVYVKTVDRYFRWYDGEWVEKAKFTVKETIQILGIKKDHACRMINKLYTRDRRSIRLSIDQIKKMKSLLSRT
jgi:hypothetical protein